MYPKNDPNERMQVQEVFGLQGGELSDAPLRYAEIAKNPLYGAKHDEKPIELKRHWARYFYDGPPGYVERDFRRRGGSCFTMITDIMFGVPALHILHGGKMWRRAAVYRSSGEAPCALRDIHEWEKDHPTAEEDGRTVSTVTEKEAKPVEGVTDAEPECPYCEEKIGKAHSYVYLGDGWAEIVYYARD